MLSIVVRSSLVIAGMLLGSCGNQVVSSDAERDAGPVTGGDVADVLDVPDVATPTMPMDNLLRLNQIQIKGTHNSYHVELSVNRLPDWKYTMPPLEEQLDRFGVRQFELDVHYMPDTQSFGVYHLPVLDDGTRCRLFSECLASLKSWSDTHRGHITLFVLIEPKDDIDRDKISGHYEQLDAEIRAVWPPDRLITPDTVRGAHATLAGALAGDGWPTLAAARGKILFILLDTGQARAEYSLDQSTLEDRVMFVLADPGTPVAAIELLDDPIRDAEAIDQAVRAGRIVRTRADGVGDPLEENRAKTGAAQDSSAHMISTDYPGAGFGEPYVFDLQGGATVRCNPTTAPPWCTPAMIEAISSAPMQR